MANNSIESIKKNVKSLLRHMKFMITMDDKDDDNYIVTSYTKSFVNFMKIVPSLIGNNIIIVEIDEIGESSVNDHVLKNGEKALYKIIDSFNIYTKTEWENKNKFLKYSKNWLENMEYKIDGLMYDDFVEHGYNTNIKYIEPFIINKFYFHFTDDVDEDFRMGYFNFNNPGKIKKKNLNVYMAMVNGMDEDNIIISSDESEESEEESEKRIQKCDCSVTDIKCIRCWKGTEINIIEGEVFDGENVNYLCKPLFHNKILNYNSFEIKLTFKANFKFTGYLYIRINENEFNIKNIGGCEFKNEKHHIKGRNGCIIQNDREYLITLQVMNRKNFNVSIYDNKLDETLLLMSGDCLVLNNIFDISLILGDYNKFEVKNLKLKYL